MDNVIQFKSQEDLDIEAMYHDWFTFLIQSICTKSIRLGAEPITDSDFAA